MRDVKTLIAEQLGVEPSEVQDDKTLFDLGADSLDLIELAIELEIEFDIEVTDDEIEAVQTVGDLVRLVERSLR